MICSTEVCSERVLTGDGGVLKMAQLPLTHLVPLPAPRAHVYIPRTNGGPVDVIVLSAQWNSLPIQGPSLER